MRTPEELTAILGTGRNQTYEALARGDIKGAIRFGRRWLIPDAVIDRLISGKPSETIA
jgi:excisionase family DNA binding protein